MRVFRAWLRWFIVLAGLLGGLSLHAQEQPIDLGNVSGSVEAEARLRIGLSAPGELLPTLQKAFSLHGAYQVRTQGTVQFQFVFTTPRAKTVEVVIKSGDLEQARRSFSASSLPKAALLAADYAVVRTTGAPGWFASELAFVSDRTGQREIYTADLLFTSGSVLQRTRHRSDVLLPDLSPDGRYLRYSTYHASGFLDIYQLDLQTNEVKAFSDYRGMNTGAAHSPDGGWVAMTLSGTTGNAELYIWSTETRKLRRLTRTDDLEADPSWSPDSRRLAFTSSRAGLPQIYTMDLNGNNYRRVPTNISRNCSEPAWNPVDADQLAFTAVLGTEFEVCLFRFSESGSRVLTRGAGDAIEPVWLRDGRHLIYTVRTARSQHLMVLDTQTGQATRLSPSGLGNCFQADVIYR